MVLPNYNAQSVVGKTDAKTNSKDLVVKALDSQSWGSHFQKKMNDSKVDSAFNSSVKWVLRISGDLAAKSKLSPRSDSVALRQLNPIHKKSHKVAFLISCKE